ncbi:hypothetical protein FORC066_0905 [Yersinia enterocolitica]|nr:hypothetical protein FORC065_3536 [Yersinia enterocolitica]UXD28121.1 hypothetical protein FORC066_0905 [Yersinia enterocolitica]
MRPEQDGQIPPAKSKTSSYPPFGYRPEYQGDSALSLQEIHSQ